MKLYLKNMVCPRCKMAVESILNEVGIDYVYVELGEVLLQYAPSETEINEFIKRIESIGFEILDDQKKTMIEKVKSLLIELAQQGDIDEHFALGEFITTNMNKEYSSISKLFTQLESITLEQYFILQKIEKVKEWLVYDEYSLSQISYKLGYSSVGYLSNQFKKITGLTPSAFKDNHRGLRKSLDKVHKA